MPCALGPFATAGSPYVRTVLVVIVGPYTFESRIHKVAVELPNIVEGLVGAQLCILYLLQICQIDGIANTTLASGIVLPCEVTMIRFIFQFVFLHLQLQAFSASAPKKSGLCNQTLSPCGWGLGTRLLDQLNIVCVNALIEMNRKLAAYNYTSSLVL